MRKTVYKKAWNHPITGILLDILPILVFLAAGLYFHGARTTLEEGCNDFWDKYSDVNMSKTVFFSDKQELEKRFNNRLGENVDVENHSFNFTLEDLKKND